MNSLVEIKEWLRIDSVDEDINTLPSLLIASKMIIKQSTGVTPEDVQVNPDALELYNLIQKMIITDLYENRNGSATNKLVIGLCVQLEAYKLVNGVVV